jgi:thiamine kinase-like enzyme
LILKTYGRFHAHSFVLRAKQPEEYSKIVSRFHNMYEELTKEANSVFRYELLEHGRLIPTYLIPGEDDEIIKKFEKYAGDGFLNVFADTIKEPGDYSVILHGDCWSNNMMFKYATSEFGRKLTDMRLLDLQFVKVGSPVCDLSYCFYSGASTADFNDLDKYLRIYYDSFSSFLTEVGADPKEICDVRSVYGFFGTEVESYRTGRYYRSYRRY